MQLLYVLVGQTAVNIYFVDHLYFRLYNTADFVIQI